MRLLFGDDIFISYARADGIIYAEGLASELARRGLSCRLDLWETVPGAELPRSLRRALRWSKMLVLIGSSRAAESPHVESEIDEFLTTPGIVIPIGFGNAVENATWFPRIKGLPITNETEPTALMRGKPSLTVLSRIENSVKFRRRNRRIRDLSAVAFVVLLSLIGLSAIAGRKAVRGLQEAERQERLAAQATAEATRQKGMADTAAKERAASERLAMEAGIREQTARRSADEQEHRAEYARKAAELEEQGTVILRQFESGIGELESLEAAVQTGRALLSLVGRGTPLAAYPATRPITALNTILANIHEKNRFPAGDGLNLLNVSPDGRRLAVVRDENRSGKAKASLWIWDILGTPLWHCPMLDNGQRNVTFERTGKGVIVETYRGLEYWDSSCKPTAVEVGHSIMIDKRHGMFAEARPNESIGITDATGKPIATINVESTQIKNLRVHPSGELVLLSRENRAIEVWRGADWAPFFDGRNELMQDFQFTGDGRFVVVEFRGGSIRVLDLSGIEVAHWTTPDGSHRLWMSPVDSQFATAGDGFIRIWDARGTLQTQISDQSHIVDVQFSEDGSRLAVVAFDTIRFINLQGERLFQLAGHEGLVRTLFLPPGGRHAITRGSDGTVRLWDLADHVSRTLIGAKHRIEDLAFLPDRDALVAVDGEGTVMSWSQSGESMRQWKISNQTDRAKVSPNRKTIALIYRRRFEIRDLNGRIIASGDLDQDERAPSVLQVALSSDAQSLAISRAGGWLQIHNIVTGRRFSQTTRGWVYGLAFDASGAKLAAALSSGNILFLDRSGNNIGGVNIRQGQLFDVSFSSDGRYMATAGADGTVVLWTSGGQFVRKIIGHSARVLTVSFSPDNQMLATAGEDRTIRLWDLKGRLLAVFPAPIRAATTEVQGGGFIGPPLKFSPDGRQLALGGDDGIVRIWQVDRLGALIDRSLEWLKDYQTMLVRKLE